ncbi:hypothetical protein F4859DRAFT_518543 [Xylaria cf. heliscus]|nr:hypothetical protein F4859DRAFT_518543 [Xylaria cf. heliscus]
MSLPELLNTLQCFHEHQSQDGALNMEMRKALYQHAAVRGLKVEQDCVGNVYLSRMAGDDTLASIAIGFPLDTCNSPRSFTGAFLAFGRLIQEEIPCGVTLMGFTSLHGKDIGLEVWEKTITMPGKPSAPIGIPSFDQFSKYPSPATFTFSAIFQISEATGMPLSLFGSSILVAKVQRFLQGQEGVRVTTQEFHRAPRLKIEGPGAEDVTRKIICAYSEYVVALFNNFD